MPVLFLLKSGTQTGDCGNGNNDIFQGNKGLKMRETGEQRLFWEPGHIENQNFNSEEQINKAIHFMDRREQVSLPSKGIGSKATTF